MCDIGERERLSETRQNSSDESAGPGAKRRSVTALFSDLVEFTPLTDRLGEEKIYELIRRITAEQEAIIDRETWDVVHTHLRCNAVARKSGSNAKSPSLLAGLIVDENGGRLRPSHANNHGRRYRYYVSNPVLKNGSNGGVLWRLPAQEIEAIVVDGIASLLGDKLRFSKFLNLDAGNVAALLSRACRMGRQFKDAGPAEQRAFLVDWVERIELRKDRINFVLRIDVMIRAIVGDALKTNKPKKCARDNGRFTIELPVAFKRRGVETKIVLPQAGVPRKAPDKKLIQAVALGHEWFAEIKHGEMRSVSELAERHGVNQSDVSRVIPLGLLAPDIVNAILDGRQPVELTAAQLKRIGDLPTSWQAQRRLLGFS